MSLRFSNCPLCDAPDAAVFYEKKDPAFKIKRYLRCAKCALIFLFHEDQSSREDEKRRYDFHANSPHDEGYVLFLKQLARPLSARILPGSRGLDFGCGPGPAFYNALDRADISLEHYDPIYFPGGPHQNSYDFIVLTEVIEHLREPGKEFRLIDRILNNGGVLGVMTNVLTEPNTFPGWWYHRDPTHIAFYQPDTLRWIAGEFNWRYEPVSDNVWIFTKPTE